MVLSLLLLVTAAAAQNSNSTAKANKNQNKSTTNANRGPVFRATADQVKQAQAILKQSSFYSGEADWETG